MTIRWQ